MKKLITTTLLISLISCCAQEIKKADPKPVKIEAKKIDPADLPSKEFLKLAQTPPLMNCWAILEGSIKHQTADSNVEVPISLRGRFSPQETRMQLIIDNKQRFRIGQIFADGFDGTVVKEEKKAPEGSKSLSHFQLRPEDMSLAFMYWDFKEELSPETVKTVRCRVFVLKHPKANEEVKVFIAVKYLFPLRVKWYKDDKLQRQLDFKSTTKIKSKIRKGVFISLPKRLIIFKEGNWRTSLNITEKKGDEINKENPPPKDLFLD